MSTLEVWRKRGIGLRFFWLVHVVDGVVVWEGGPYDWKGISDLVTGLGSGSTRIQNIFRRQSSKRTVGLLNDERAQYDVSWAMETGLPDWWTH